jgi:hypothetical protein
MEEIMKAVTSLSLALVLALAAAGVARAEDPPRQDYSKYWEQHKSGGYYFLDYKFKPDPEQKDYSHYYCIFYPARPSHFYYYDPDKDLYRGRYNLKTKHFEFLDEKATYKRLADIPESAFQERPRGQQKIPGANDVAMKEPPTDDLPGKPGMEKKSLDR